MSAGHRLRLDSVPELAGLLAAQSQLYPFLLESTAHGGLGQCSLLLRASDEVLQLDADGELHGPHAETGFLDSLANWYACEASHDSDTTSDWPFAGGWFVYLGYELAGEIEPILQLPPAGDGLPVALAVRCRGAVVVKHGQPEQAWLVAESAELLAQMQQELQHIEAPVGRPPVHIQHLQPEPGTDFTEAVKRIQTYLADGDVFQVNLSRSWRGEFSEPVAAADIYRQLRDNNPAPFAGLMCWQGQSLLSSSPERLVEVRGRAVQTRPIAGTYPRGGDSDSDMALSRDLLAHPKERAEHIMLIDLERNDLGRVCETGSVEVSELMVLESYAHVHHIVSNVRGVLRKQAGPVDVLRAVFPGGTITGCPKVRCMQIIAELEQRGRGFYTGSMGYLGLDGQMDMNILIRSMLVSGRQVSLRTGAGIVMDSDPQRELSETKAKARGLLLALGVLDA